MAWYLKTGEAETLGQLTAYELKRYLGELRDRDLADNTIHGFFEVLRAFASWADRERYPVDPALLRVRAPKVAQKEVETYSREQLERIFAVTAPGWPTIAVKPRHPARGCLHGQTSVPVDSLDHKVTK
jgi:site-specific recombinase XerD